MGYGEATANSANVVYPFAESLPAARAVTALAGDLLASRTDLSGHAADAVVDWTGPQRDTFDAKHETLRGSVTNVDSALRHLGSEIARSWAAARGQQDRINYARWVQWDIEQDNAAENLWEHFAGETDYAPGPEDPPAPQPDDFPETRQPIKANFA